MANKTLKELSNVKFPRAVEKSEVEKILIHLSSRNSFRGMYLPQEVQGTYKNGKMTISATSIGGTIGRDGTTLYFDFKRQKHGELFDGLSLFSFQTEVSPWDEDISRDVNQYVREYFAQ
ncbi:MAG: hypothetical protein AABX28_03740 [Nanoarchaeota archaeon]